MPRRNSPNEIHGLSDLSHLGELVFDKRLGQRAIAKKNRRNRHYEKQFIRNTLTHHAAAGFVEPTDPETDVDVDTDA
jgi:succinate dehydrogenase/fumarate reductase flavoprotein subunit